MVIAIVTNGDNSIYSNTTNSSSWILMYVVGIVDIVDMVDIVDIVDIVDT